MTQEHLEAEVFLSLLNMAADYLSRLLKIVIPKLVMRVATKQKAAITIEYRQPRTLLLISTTGLAGSDFFSPILFA